MSAAKSSIADLGVLGGAPAFKNVVEVGRPNIGDRRRFLARIEEMLDRQWLSGDGPFVREFETRVAEFVGVRHCVAVCNGTQALELLFQALGLSGEIVLPSFTYVATAHAARRSGLTPVFCDIAPGSPNIDVRSVEELITPRTCAIAGVHCWGIPCDIEALSEIAVQRGLELIFDAAHAFGCSHGGRMIGGFGRAEVFSFNAAKFFHSIEGGAVVTDDPELAGRLRLLRNLGFSSGDQTVIAHGTNARMTEASAAMGLTSFDALEETVAINRDHYCLYSEGLRGVPGVELTPYNEGERQNFQYVAATVDERTAGLSRDLLLQALSAENIVARRYFFPGCHRVEPYRSNGGARLPLPETERLAAGILQFPTGSQMSPEAVAAVCDVVRFVVSNADALSRQLGSLENNVNSRMAWI